MNPTTMAEKSMFPTCGSNPSGGEPDAVKVACPVRWGGWRRPAGAARPSAALSPPNRLRSESVVGPVPQGPRDMVKAELPEPQFPDGVTFTRR